MNCFGKRQRFDDIRPEQKWDFISLNDFKSSNCWEFTLYGYLWISLLISCAVYGLDTFTAVNLLAFDKWSSSVEPFVSLNISKWIFSGCIIASWVNLGYEHFRAFRIIRRGAVAESYLDSLAVRIQSARVGQVGRGWRRFLVFSELTKSKKGAEYVALFTYFSFQSWIRVIFCSGPRQVINAFTLYAFLSANLNGQPNAGASILQLFTNIKVVAQTDRQQAIILASMLFTFVIWVVAAMSLILAVLFYILFLWHYIPNSDGGLSAYCERKINGRLQKIVSVKVEKALRAEERKNHKRAARAAAKGDKHDPALVGRQPTLPTFLDPKGDELPAMPAMSRSDTVATLPMYTSRPGTPSSQQPTIPDLELANLSQRPLPFRTGTAASAMSNASYASNAPLIGGAAEMGYGRTGSPAPPMPQPYPEGFSFPQRAMTSSTNGSQFSRGPRSNSPPILSRQPTRNSFADGQPQSLSRSTTQDSYPGRSLTRQNTGDYVSSPASYSNPSLPRPPSPQPTLPDLGPGAPGFESNKLAASTVSMNGQDSSNPTDRQTPYSTFSNSNGRSSPAPSSLTNDRSGHGNGSASPYVAFNPYPNPNVRSASANLPARQPNFSAQQRQQPHRNMTEPVPPRLMPSARVEDNTFPLRSGTPSSVRHFQGPPASNPYYPYSTTTSNGSAVGSLRGAPPRNATASPASYNVQGTPGSGPRPGQTGQAYGYRQ